MSTIEVFQKAKELISDESKWSRDGMSGGRFCVAQAICKMSGWGYSSKDPLDVYRKANGLEPDEKTSANTKVFRFNDGHTHAEVLASIDHAIEYAKKHKQ